MKTQLDDNALVRRVQSGERGAFDALVGKYRQRVMKLSLRYVHNHADAEDAVQETFLKAYGGLKHFRGEAAFYSWLHRIAINSAKTISTSRARHAGLLAAEPLDELNDGAAPFALETPEQLMRTEEIGAAVRSAIESLCEEQRTAILLREFQGLSYAEVARVMNCPVGTVRSRVYRARETIDERLRQVFDDGLGRMRRRPAERPEAHLRCA